MRGRILPILQRAAGGKVGERFGLAVNPEFMREGSAVADFRKAPRTVIGEFDADTADKLISIYSALDTSVLRTGVEVAETVKYADNSWHALKVAFANEIAAICSASRVDSRAVMDMFCADEVLNISRAYLRPGFAFGGSCLSNDISALVRHAAAQGLELPVLSHIVPSNTRAIAQGIEQILQNARGGIGFLGLAYKAGVGDLRGSPYVEVVKQLQAAGCTVRAFDPNVSRLRAVTGKRTYAQGQIADLDELLIEDADELLAWAQTVVVTTDAPEYAVALKRVRSDHVLIDLAGGIRIGVGEKRRCQPTSPPAATSR